MMKIVAVLVVVAALLGGALGGRSAEFFTSPAGTAAASGSIGDPLDLAAAINATTSPVHAGDTLWIRGGIYTAPLAGFVFSISGDSSRPLVFRNYHNERAIIDGTFKAHGKYVHYWGLEFTDLTTPYLPMTLTRAQKEAQMLGGSYSFCSYYLESVAFSKFINNIFHDSFGQIEYGVSSSNSVLYGNIVMNLGEQCLDNERGVGIYAQNRDGTRELTDNMVAQNILNGIDVWSSGNSYINNFTLDGNICFNNGYGSLQGGHNMLAGAGNGCTNLLIVSNVLYYAVDTYNRPNLIVGHGGQSFAPRIYNTLAINGGFELTESFGRMEFIGNELLSSSVWNSSYVVWPRDLKPTSYVFSNNKYYGSPLLEITAWITNAANPGGAFLRTAPPSGWPGWQQLGSFYPTVGSGFRPDADSLYTSAKPSGTRVIIRPNRYEVGRAHIAILNFDLKSTVDLDLSSLGLPLNTVYELHPVQNLYNQTNTGTYTGAPISVPMTGWGLRQPQSRAKDLTSTFPQFGAFLFIARGTAGAAAPLIGTIPDQSVTQGGTTGEIGFTVGVPDSQAGAVTLSAASDNAALVPVQDITLGGSGALRTISITPQSLRQGTAAITVTVDDGLATASRTFRVTVSGASRPPIILSYIPDISIPVNGVSSTFLILVGDPDTATGSLSVIASCSDPVLVPESGIRMGGFLFFRTIRITPTVGATGSAVVTISVSDGVATTLQSFRVDVGSVIAAAPPLTAPSSLTLIRNLHVDAGSNAVVYSPLSYRLRGEVTVDGPSVPAGAPGILWSMVSGPGQVTFADAGAPAGDAMFSMLGFYRLRLTAMAGILSNSDEVYILVKAAPDTTPPVMSGLSIAEVAVDSVRVAWETDEPATGQVEFEGGGVSGVTSVAGARLGRTHLVTVSNLVPDTLYAFHAKAWDERRNQSDAQSLRIRTLRSTFAYLPLTAEAALLEAPMTLVDDFAARGEVFLGTPAEDQGKAAWKFYAPVPGVYHLWGRVQLPSTGQGSFFLSVNGWTNEVYDAAGFVVSSAWQWTRINVRGGVLSPMSAPRVLRLKAGLQTLIFGGREPQTLLDRVLVTNDPDYVPSDAGILAGVDSPARITEPVYRLRVPAGWSMIGNPLNPSDPRFSAILSSWLSGAEYDRYNPAAANFSPTVFSDGGWSDADLTLGQGEGGLFHNPSDSPMILVLTGAVGSDPAPLELRPGVNLVCGTRPVSGQLGALLGDFHFVANDRVHMIDSDRRGYHVHTYRGDRWDEIPVLNLGESAFVELVPR